MDTSSSIPLAQRLALVLGVPAFACLPEGLREELASRLDERQYPPRSCVIAEGEPGDTVYLIAEGRAEVVALSPAGRVVLAVLEPGELFGEMALLSASGARSASITALSQLHVLTLDAPTFHSLVASHPNARQILAAAVETMQVSAFLKRSSPFAALNATRVRLLAARLETRRVVAGAIVVHQGEPGNVCYLVRAGRVEVVVAEADGSERRLGTLGYGAIVGEAALLTDAPRNATVRALEPTDLLVLRRSDLLEVMRDDQLLADQLVDLLLVRDRPRQAPGIVAQHQTTSEGETITILKDARRGAYFRLSEQGWFLWQRLDGRHNLRDLTVEYLAAFKAFAPEAVTQLVRGLVAAGFVESRRLRADVASPVSRRSFWRRVAGALRRLLEWEVSVRGVDPAVTRLYRLGLWTLFTPPALLLLGVLSVAGLLAFWVGTVRATGAALTAGDQPALLFLLLPAYALAVVAHEAGHAVTIKACGREVNRVGFGWYWFGPMVFVDTSDIWLATRWQRIAVSLAGVGTNVVLAGIAALGAGLASNPILIAALTQFALTSYIAVLINLNPLLEFDGYYVLVDLLHRPNLRPHCLEWLRWELPRASRRPRELWQHRLELLYGVASVVYVAGMALLTLFVFRLVMQDWLSHVVPTLVSASLAWLFAAAVALLSVTGIIGDLIGVQRVSEAYPATSAVRPLG